MNLFNSLKPLLESPVPELDRRIICCLNLSYGILERSCRLTLWKEQADRPRLMSKKFWLSIGTSPLYYVLSALKRSFGRWKGKDGSHLMNIHVPNQNYKYVSIIEKGDFISNREEAVVQHFTPKQGDFVIDVGAHIGRYTLVSSKLVRPTGRVIAIEADPDSFDLLNQNIALNGLSNVLPINCAAYSQQTEITLYRPSPSSLYRGIITTRAERAIFWLSEHQNYVKVCANTLDEILHLNGKRKINWIKIDVEGAEFEVLKGATQLLSESDELSILVEIHDILDRHHEKNIIDFLRSLNCEIKFVQSYDRTTEKHMIFLKSK